MLKVFDSVNFLDERCYSEFSLDANVLMENASLSMANHIKARFKAKSKILIVCGGGNNGADGITLARQLHGDYKVDLHLASPPKSDMAKLQHKRAQLVGVKTKPLKLHKKNRYNLIVDALFGSGFNPQNLDEPTKTLLTQLNTYKCHKIACDIPSGIGIKGYAEVTFKAHATITMGAIKSCLLEDSSKDFVGKIIVGDLGISHKIYQTQTNTYMLERQDLKLPKRTLQNTHKGSFGHVAVLMGNLYDNLDSKIGAGLLALKASSSIGAGLCTAITQDKLPCELEIMSSPNLPNNLTVLLAGMGFGQTRDFSPLRDTLASLVAKQASYVLDADLLCHEEILKHLNYEHCVITPHPKEFTKLLEQSRICTINTATLQQNRFKYIRQFCELYPKCTVVLKGANTLIAKGQMIYVQPLGTPALSKGGSGDVLAGVIGGLIAQGFSPLEASYQASLICALSAKSCKSNSYALTPLELINSIKYLRK